MLAKKKTQPPDRPSLISRCFGLDLRSLAAFRVGLALFILYDLFSRSRDLIAHYTDAGTLPRAFAVRYFSLSPIYSSWNPGVFSLHLATGTALGIGLIFLLHALAAIGLLVGCRTRLMTFVVWFLLASLHTRNPLVLSVGDDVLRVVLFFALFLPLGARYSIDAALNSGKDDSQNSETYISPSTAIYYLQFIGVYFFSALLKTGPEWRSEGTALYYAFSLDQFALPLARALLKFPEFLKILTFAAWWIELLGAFILALPSPAGKLAGIFLFAGLQFGIGATLALGHNPWVNAIALLPFLPGSFWNRSRIVFRRRPKVEVVYDGDCGFCRKLVLILVEFLSPRLNSAPRPAQGRDLAVLRRENSWIVRSAEAGFTPGHDFFRFEAFLQLVRSSLFFFWTVPVLRLRPVQAIGAAVYRVVASHRPILSKLLAPFRFRPVRLSKSWWREALAVFFFAGVLIYNLAWIVPMHRLNDYFVRPTLIVRLEQYWGMFAPAPSREDGWFVVEGRLRDGSKVEAFRAKREISYEKPDSAAGFYPGERWRRYLMNLGTRDFKDFRAPFARYLCGTWNEKNSGSGHLERISIFFMRETTPPPGQSGNIEKLDLIDYACAN